MAKYDWAELKRKYVTGKHKSLRAFADSESIPYNAYFKKATSGWADEKRLKRDQKETKITEAVTGQQIQAVVDRNAAHLAAGDLIMQKLNKAIADIEGKDALYSLRTAADALEKTQRIQKLGDREGEAEESIKYAGLPARVLGKAYVDIYRDILERKHRFYDLKGGRGSLKSSFCGEIVIDEIERNPNFCALAVRHLKDGLKDSVYAQIVWAIDELGLSDDYHCTKNPLEIKKKSTGQIVYFRGGDEPAKIKSIKPPNGMYIGVVWIEEADQLHGPEAYRNILQSAMRGGDDTIVLRSYNTPRSQAHFINKEERENNPLRILHHSHFKDAPPEWLGKGFYELAERLKETNETAYRHEYDGEAVGTGGMVFENIRAESIPQRMVDSFDNILNGVDWGYYPDPWTFNRVQLDSASRTLYIFYEDETLKKSARETVGRVKEQIRDGDIVTCDNKEENCSDYRAFGVSARGAIKGPDSRKYSYEWLQSLNAIVIDPARCPRTLTEFLEYEYERDKNGDVISEYPDGNDHHIDAVRYATERIWRRRGR